MGTIQGALRDRNVLEVIFGFLGWFGINTLLWIWVLANEPGTLFLNPLRLLPLCTNIPVLLVLGIRRGWVTLGILAALLVNAIGVLLFTAPGLYVDQGFGHVLAMRPFYLSFLVPF